MNWLKQYRNELFIFMVLLLCYSYFLPRWASWNQNSRLDLVLSIVDEGTLHIDKYYQNTGDYACFNRDTGQPDCVTGHYYSDKAPGTAFLAVPVYAAVRPILRSAPVQQILNRLAQSPSFGETLKEDGTGLRNDKIYFAIVLYLVTVAVVSIPAAILGVLIYRFLGIFNQHNDWRVGVVLLYGLATNAFPYSGSFLGHQIVAFLLFGAFYLVFLIGQRKLSERWIILTGFMLGYAVITEYPTALIAGVIFGYGLLSLPDRRWTLGFILGGLPPGLLLMAYDWAIFGNILPIGYKYSELYKDTVHAQGFISLVGPNLPALWGITFSSYRGLFFIAPVLLLAIPGFVVWWQQKQYRLEWGLCLWTVLSFLLFNGSSVMWEGGYSIGPRYLLPMLPFMTIGLGVFVCQWGQHGWAKLLLVGLGIWSFVVVWTEAIGGQSFPDWTRNPFFNYSLPNLLAGNIARNLGMVMTPSGLWSLLPLFITLGVLTWLWRLNGRRDTRPSQPLTSNLGVSNRSKELQTDV